MRAWTVVDQEDYETLNRPWSFSEGYAVRAETIDGRRQRIFMHRWLLGLDRGDQRQGDHINRNRLDNRKSNLRILSRGENAQNRCVQGASRFRGVSWHSQKKKWRARVEHNGRQHHLGLFESEEEAGAVAAAFRAKLLPFSTN